MSAAMKRPGFRIAHAVRGIGFALGGIAGFAVSANAGCIHTNQLWSCIDASGNPVQLYCIGVGVVLSCNDFAGGWILVSPHEVLSQISVDSQVSSALDAQRPQPQPNEETLSVGTNGIAPKGPGTHP